MWRARGAILAGQTTGLTRPVARSCDDEAVEPSETQLETLVWFAEQVRERTNQPLEKLPAPEDWEATAFFAETGCVALADEFKRHIDATAVMDARASAALERVAEGDSAQKLREVIARGTETTLTLIVNEQAWRDLGDGLSLFRLGDFEALHRVCRRYAEFLGMLTDD